MNVEDCDVTVDTANLTALQQALQSKTPDGTFIFNFTARKAGNTSSTAQRWASRLRLV